MAVDVSDVDKSRVTAGEVTTANLPQACKNCLRSSSSLFCKPIMPSHLIIHYLILDFKYKSK